MPISATFFIVDGRFSWSETYWSPSSGDAALPGVLKDAVALGTVRTRLFGSSGGAGPSIEFIRVSDRDTLRDSLIDTSLAAGNLTSGDRLSLPPDRPYSTLLIRCESGSRYRKSIYLSGIPDAVITDPDGPTLVAGFDKVLAAFFKALIGTWGFLSRRDATESPPISITSFAGDPALNNATVITYVGPALPNDSSILVSKGVWAIGAPHIHGAFRVFNTAAGTAHLRRSTYAGGYEGGALFRPLGYTVRMITSAQVRAMTHRKRGVLGGSPPRGRLLRRP